MGVQHAHRIPHADLTHKSILVCNAVSSIADHRRQSAGKSSSRSYTRATARFPPEVWRIISVHRGGNARRPRRPHAVNLGLWPSHWPAVAPARCVRDPVSVLAPKPVSKSTSRLSQAIPSFATRRRRQITDPIRGSFVVRADPVARLAGTKQAAQAARRGGWAIYQGLQLGAITTQ